MPTISEPLHEARSWTFSRCRAAFIAEAIGIPAFRLSLRNLGLPLCDVESEIALAKSEMTPGARMRLEFLSPAHSE